MTKKSNIQQTQMGRPIISNPRLQTIFIDSIEIGFREDDLCFLRMVTELPEGKVEQGKFFITRPLLEKFITGVSEALTPTPKKTGAEKEKKSGKSLSKK